MLRTEMGDLYDFLIIGGGTAGMLLANRLSADPEARVLLIEAGGRDSHPWIHIPVGYLYCINNPRTDWCLRTQPVPGLNGRSLLYPRGKTLGGSSSINGMIYMRGQRRDYDAWAEATGEPDWRWDKSLPDFVTHESNHRFDSADRHPDLASFHGSDGEWRVEKQRLRWEILDAFAQAAQQAGVPASDDFNRGDNEGVGYFEVNQKNGWRWNTAKAFLRPVQRLRKNLTVWTHAQVTRLIIEQNADGQLRCVGAAVMRGATRTIVRAAREVVLSAGSIGTPQLLQLSGIGPAELLQQHGITVLKDAAGVGANLQDHLQLRLIYGVQGVTTLNTLARRWWGKAKIGLEYAMTRSGPMSMAPSQLGAFARSDPQQTHPNIQFHVQPLSLPAFGQPLHDYAAFTASVCNLNPTSRGTVQITSADFRAVPAIAPNYLDTQEDRTTAAASIRFARLIVEQPALARYHPEELQPGLQYESDEDLARLAGDIGTTIFHPVGTARMGRAEDPLAVVDPRLRVIGVSNLRIADASIMPTITSGNTNSPTLMIAEKAARWIASDKK
jgi:choline dehydrogenase